MAARALIVYVAALAMLRLGGKIDRDQMREAHISRDDPLRALRSSGKVFSPEGAERAELERSGH